MISPPNDPCAARAEASAIDPPRGAAGQDVERAELVSSIAEQGRRFRSRAIQLAGPAFLPHDLTVQQLRVLAVIGGSPGISGHALGQALGVSDPTASGLVERLAERALISRREDPADRRVRRLCLTTTGAEVLADVDSVSRRVMELLLPRLAMGDLRQLNRLYAVMLDALGAED